MSERLISLRIWLYHRRALAQLCDLFLVLRDLSLDLQPVLEGLIELVPAPLPLDRLVHPVKVNLAMLLLKPVVSQYSLAQPGLNFGRPVEPGRVSQVEWRSEPQGESLLLVNLVGFFRLLGFLLVELLELLLVLLDFLFELFMMIYQLFVPGRVRAQLGR